MSASELDSTLDSTDRSDSPTETTLSDVSRRHDAAGFDGQFGALPNAQVQCLTCRRATPANALDANDMTRLEGESDPADMAVVVALRCPACGTRGTLILNYGPDASGEETDVLAAMDRRPERSARQLPQLLDADGHTRRS